LQWGRRVHSAKSLGVGERRERERVLQWGRRVHSAKSGGRASDGYGYTIASMGSPSSLGEEKRTLGDFERRTIGFNGVAEFTRRRARIRREHEHDTRASMGSPSSLGEELAGVPVS